MNVMPLGDYYVWYCDWCDTRNLTLWTRLEKNEITCGACHRKAHVAGQSAGHGGRELAMSAIL